MKLVRLTLWRLPLTSKTAYYMADGKTCDTVESVLLRADTDAGISGWGEVCPIPHYLPAYAGGVVVAVEEMLPALLGKDPLGGDAVTARMDAHLLGHPYAKSAVDIALWDITARAANMPLYVLLGGGPVRELPLYHSITCVAPEQMAAIAKEQRAAGITQLQVKLGADDDWEMDVARLRLVREAVGRAPLVYGDWNCGVSRLHAIRVGRAVASADIMLEQPCTTLEACAAVRTATGLPMKIDENAHDIESLLRAHELGCLDAVAIKLSKFGGLSACRRARDLCLHLNTKMCIEDTWGTDVAMAAALHLATATPAAAVLNVCDLSAYVSPQLDKTAPSRRNGYITPPRGVGLGVSPDVEILGTPVAVFE